MSPAQFPHFYRRISARIYFLFRLSFWSILSFIIILNLLYDFTISFERETLLKNEVLKNPFNHQYHEKLGEYYLTLNKNAAEREFKLADIFFEDLHPINLNVQGSEARPWQTWQNILSLQKKTADEFSYWEKVNQAYPSYQYAILKMAVLSLELGEKNKSHELLEKVINNIPQDKTTLMLRDKLESLQ